MIYILAIRHVLPRNHTNMAINFTVNFVIIENRQENKILRVYEVSFVNRTINMLGISHSLVFKSFYTNEIQLSVMEVLCHEINFFFALTNGKYSKIELNSKWLFNYFIYIL